MEEKILVEDSTAPNNDAERYARIKAAQNKKPKRSPRAANTYRGARRNAARGKVWMISGQRFDVEVKEGWTPAAELNRSPNWTRATSYAYAREISPCPERPVR